MKKTLSKMRVSFCLISDGCVNEIIEQIKFKLCDAGKFVLGHEVAFQLNAPAEALICAGAAVIGSFRRTGKNGHIEAVQTQQICNSAGKPQQKTEYKNQEQLFDDFNGIHGKTPFITFSHHSRKDDFCKTIEIFVIETSFDFWDRMWYSYSCSRKWTEKRVILYGKGEGNKADCAK